MPDNPSITIAVRLSMLRGRDSVTIPPIDRSFYAPIGGVLIAGSMQERIITEYLRALVSAVPEPADDKWERSHVGSKIKLAKKKTRIAFADYPAVRAKLLSLLRKAKRLQSDFRNVVSHGQFVASFPKSGDVTMEIHYSKRGKIRRYSYTADEIEQAFHDMLLFATELQECFDNSVSDPELSSSDKEALSAFLAAHHPQGSIFPMHLAQPE